MKAPIEGFKVCLIKRRGRSLLNQPLVTLVFWGEGTLPRRLRSVDEGEGWRTVADADGKDPGILDLVQSGLVLTESDP
jgi:hypothetical protein